MFGPSNIEIFKHSFFLQCIYNLKRQLQSYIAQTVCLKICKIYGNFFKQTVQFLDRIDSWELQDPAEQSSYWIVYIPGNDRMLQSRAVPG